MILFPCFFCTPCNFHSWNSTVKQIKCQSIFSSDIKQLRPVQEAVRDDFQFCWCWKFGAVRNHRTACRHSMSEYRLSSQRRWHRYINCRRRSVTRILRVVTLFPRHGLETLKFIVVRRKTKTEANFSPTCTNWNYSCISNTDTRVVFRKSEM